MHEIPPHGWLTCFWSHSKTMGKRVVPTMNLYPLPSKPAPLPPAPCTPLTPRTSHLWKPTRHAPPAPHTTWGSIQAAVFAMPDLALGRLQEIQLARRSPVVGFLIDVSSEGGRGRSERRSSKTSKRPGRVGPIGAVGKPRGPGDNGAYTL